MSRRRILTAALCIVLVLTGILLFQKKDRAEPAEPPIDAADTAALDALVTDARKAWQVPGLAVAVIRDDRVVYLKGFGVRTAGQKEPVTPDTLFPIASCTKAFTTTSMAMLVDEGKMSWDDPVRRHVPQFRLADPLANEKATLRDLVSHRAGLGSNDFLWYRSPWSREEVVRRIGLVKPKYPFRAGFEYQSTMFTVAGMAVESASGHAWEDFVRARIGEPLGMTSLAFTTTEAKKNPNRAAAHRLGDDGLAHSIDEYALDRPEPAGSMYASARDLSRWVRFQLGDGTWEGRRLVAAAALHETHMPQTIIPLKGAARALNPDTTQMNYGMAWVIQDYKGRLLVSHAGQVDGFRAHFTLAPRERIGIVLLNNLDRTQMNLALSNAILDKLLDLPARDWNAFLHEQLKKDADERQAKHQAWLAKRNPEAGPSRPLAAYAGTYADPAYGSARVILEDGSLVWKWSTFSAPLVHFQFDTFVVRDAVLGYPQAVFTLDRDGEPAGIDVAYPLGVEFRRIVGRANP